MDRLWGRSVIALMDVLIMERNELVGSMLADTLDSEEISAAVLADEEALQLPPDQPPQLVITCINRTYAEDLRGLMLVSVLRRKWPRLSAIYLAALWPARLSRRVLTTRERFFSMPIDLAAMICAVRELLPSMVDGRDVGRMQSDKPAPEERPSPAAPEPVLPDPFPLDDEPARRPVPPRAPPDPIVAVLARRWGRLYVE